MVGDPSAAHHHPANDGLWLFGGLGLGMGSLQGFCVNLGRWLLGFWGEDGKVRGQNLEGVAGGDGSRVQKEAWWWTTFVAVSL